MFNNVWMKIANALLQLPKCIPLTINQVRCYTSLHAKPFGTTDQPESAFIPRQSLLNMVLKNGTETALPITLNLISSRYRPLHAEASNDKALRKKAIPTFPWNKATTTKFYHGQRPQEFFQCLPLMTVTNSVLLLPVLISYYGSEESGCREELDLCAPHTCANCWYIRPHLAYPETIISSMFGYLCRSIKVKARFKDFC